MQTEGKEIQFPAGFIWGADTSAYQIEGAWNEDGRGPSIWDTFCRIPGKIHAGETGDSSADHYHHWQEDVDLMSQIGLKAYRFSIAWTRIFPTGKGQPNQRGLDFYDRLIDALLAKGITPYPTLFHYDLPQALQDQGGWLNRDTARYFGDYAHYLASKLGDRATCWITHNEPWVTAFLGHLTGEHAPGMHNPVAAVSSLHHVLLSHGFAVQALRAAAPQPVKVGIAVNLSPIYPRTPLDEGAATFTDAFINRIVLDPLLKGHYPPDFTSSRWWRWLEGWLNRRPNQAIQTDDFKLISAPLDFLGVNYYTRSIVRRIPIIQSMQVKPADGEFSQMWEIYPTGIYDLLVRLHKDYAHPNLIVTENGVPVVDELADDGYVHDPERIHYLQRHIQQVNRAIQAGVPISGYFVWSLIDNFEWVYGYTRRFGLVYVDFDTKKRIMKESGRWYAEVIRRNGILAEPAV